MMSVEIGYNFHGQTVAVTGVVSVIKSSKAFFSFNKIAKIFV